MGVICQLLVRGRRSRACPRSGQAASLLRRLARRLRRRRLRRTQHTLNAQTFHSAVRLGQLLNSSCADFYACSYAGRRSRSRSAKALRLTDFAKQNQCFCSGFARTKGGFAAPDKQQFHLTAAVDKMRQNPFSSAVQTRLSSVKQKYPHCKTLLYSVSQ